MVVPVFKLTPSPAPGEPDPAEIRLLDVGQAREEVREGIQRAVLDVETESFEAAQKELDDLMDRAQRYPEEMQEEIRQARALRDRLIEARVAARTREQEKELERAAWEKRLQQIQSLMQREHYPEAISQANDLSNEPGVPETVAARARELSTHATQELKKVWGETRMGPTQNKIRKEPPKNRERIL